MNRRAFTLSLAMFFALHLVAVSAETRRERQDSAPKISYRLSIPKPERRRLHIHLLLEHPESQDVRFSIPAWTPGYYQILTYQTDIEALKARDGKGNSLPWTHDSARSWTVHCPLPGPPPDRLELDYDVYAHDAGLGFFGTVLDPAAQRGYVNGASAFLYVDGMTQSPVSLEVGLPTGWNIATPLPPLTSSPPTPNPAVTRYQASSYDDLIDSPLQFGQFSSTEFQSDGATFTCACIGSTNWDKAKVAVVLTKIVHAAIQVFGKPPFRHYLFLYHIGGGGFSGGLEHHNSTVIHLGSSLRDGSSEEFQSVTAHEFFHAWNVKRVRPLGLGPFDYTQPVRTASLWWAEGVTDYYADLILFRAGLRDRSWLLNDLSDRIGELENTPSRHRVTLEEASRRAWEGGSEGFDGLSYYLKGSLAGLYFDLRIRTLSGGKRSLDDVMRLLDAEYGAKGKGYPEEAVLKALESVAQTDLRTEYHAVIQSAEEIAWDDVFSAASLLLQQETVSYLGIQIRPAEPVAKSGVLIQSIEPGSAAARLSLRPGDRILTLNGEEVRQDTLITALHKLPPKSALTLAVERGSERLVLTGDSGERFQNTTLAVKAVNVGTPGAPLLFEATMR